MRTLHAATLAAVAVLLGGCFSNSTSSGTNNDPGPTNTSSGNNAPAAPVTAARALFAPTAGVLPYPTDLYFSGTTDGTLNISSQLANFTPNLAALNASDGFGVNTDITVRFSAPINGATLASNVRVVRVSVDNATKATTGVLGLLQPNVDYSIAVSPDIDTGGTVMLIRPLRPLVPSTGGTNNGYLVLVSNGVRAASGTAFEADTEYAQVRAGAIADIQAGLSTPTCASVTNATLNGVCRLTFAHLRIGASLPGALAIPPQNVIASFSFSTISVRDTLALIAQTTTARPYTVTALGRTTAGLGLPVPGIADVYNGTLKIPYYLGVPSTTNPTAPLTTPWEAAGPSSVPGIDPASRFLTRFNPFPVKVNAQLDIPMLITIPNAASGKTKPPTGWPVVIFQHGFPTDRSDALLLADTMAAAGFAVVAIDAPLHGITPSSAAYAQPLKQTAIERTFNLDFQKNGQLGVPGPDGQVDTSGANFFNPTNGLVQRDNFRQAVADLIALVRTIPTIDVDAATNPGPDFDASRIHMIGYSAGGAYVVPVLGLLGSEIKASAIPSAASKIADTFFVESPRYSALTSQLLAAQGVLPNTTLYRQFVRDLQNAIDPGEPLNYAATAANNPPNLRPIYASFFQGGGGTPPAPTDNTVPVVSTQRLIDLMGITNRVVAAGATSVAGTAGGYVPFSQGSHGSLLDPTTSLATTQEIQKQIATFFATGGSQIVITNPAVIAQ